MQAINVETINSEFKQADRYVLISNESKLQWLKSLEMYGIKTSDLMQQKNNSQALVVNSSDFSFAGVDASASSTKGILMVIPAALVHEAEGLLSLRFLMNNAVTMNLKYCHPVSMWVSPRKFVLEMNARLLQEIGDYDSKKITKDGMLQIPVILIAGEMTTVTYIQMYLEQYVSLLQHEKDIKEKWNPKTMSKINREKAEKIYKQMVSSGTYPPYGMIIGGMYLRLWTQYDRNAY